MSPDEVYNILKDEILSLKILPGELISENDISKRFNISRTPIRAAFLRLSTDNLIEIKPQKGTYVSLLDFDLIKQLIYMRKVLETNVISSALEAIDQSVIEQLDDNIARQKAFLENQSNPQEFYLLDSELHKICFDLVEKEKLWNIIQDFQVHYTRFRMLDIVVTKEFKSLYEEHCIFVDLLKHKQIEQIKPFIEKHLSGGIDRLGDRLKRDFKSYFLE